jgi:hypothetical protein
MFFRREAVKKLTFSDYLDNARKAGFTVEASSGGLQKVSRDGVAALLQEVPDKAPAFAESPGIVIGSEIARLVDGGYQKFIQTPSRKKRAALAADLVAIHRFEEDLRAVLDMGNTYNLSLGTVSNHYIYDRVEDRDHPAGSQPWKIATSLKVKA